MANRTRITTKAGKRLSLRLSYVLGAITLGLCGLTASRATEVTPAGSVAEATPTSGAMIRAPLSTSNNKFGVGLFQKLLRSKPESNILISPVSVNSALTLFMEGCSGNTRQELAKMLDVGDGSPANALERMGQLRAVFEKSDPKVTLDMANAIFVDTDTHLIKAYADDAKTKFHAKVQSLDFGDSAGSTGIINGFVSTHTHGKIPKIIESTDKNDALMIVNALYFKGIWTEQFDAKDTQKGDFRLSDGARQPVHLMKKMSAFQYIESPEYQAVSLPYGNNRFSMQIFLPRKKGNEQEFFLGWTADHIDRAAKAMRKCEGRVRIPKFKIECEETLNGYLQALGMKSAFSAACNMSKMVAAPGHHVSKVVHKTFMDVNEEGTEAAAVTVINDSKSLFPQEEQRFEFVADHPFLVTLRENQSGTILFIGAIKDPTGKSSGPVAMHVH